MEQHQIKKILAKKSRLKQKSTKWVKILKHNKSNKMVIFKVFGAWAGVIVQWILCLPCMWQLKFDPPHHPLCYKFLENNKT